MEEESQKHLLECSKLSNNDVVIGANIPKYEDLFSTEMDKVEVIGRILLQKFQLLHRAQLVQASAAT